MIVSHDNNPVPPHLCGMTILLAEEISTTIGSFGFFTMLFLLFVKLWPSVSIYEVKEDIGIPMKKGHH
jgi:hypothetical protein